jgi:branched-chain amino acid transport system permease protein
VTADSVRLGTTASRVFSVAALAVVAWMATIAIGGSSASQTKVVELSVFVVVASMWNLLAGYSGLVSIGQQAFVGLGAYALIVFGNGFEQDIYFSLAPAAVVVALAAVPVGLLAFRLRGGYFAIGTWVIAEVVRLLVKQYKGDPIKGGSGASLDAPTALYPKADRFQTTALLALALAVLAVVVIAVLLRSRLGLALQAVRDNEGGAASLGVNVYRARFAVYVVAALFTGVAGAVWYLLKLRVQPDTAFGVADWTAPIVVMVVIGGLGTIEGPIVGAVGWYVLRDYLTSDGAIVRLDEQWYLIVTGLVAVVFALFVQGGLWGLLQRLLPSMQLFPVRRRLQLAGALDDHRGRR